MKRKTLVALIVCVLLVAAFVVSAILVRGAETHVCHECDGEGCEACGGAGVVDAESIYSETYLALAAPVIAIVLALITKEVYSSLFIGIVIGGLLYGGFSPTASLDAVLENGLIAAVSDSAGIFIFLVILGAIVALINRAGGSQAFGKWAEAHIKTRVGAILATFALGVLIFIDDYFNCLTVGSVMRPLTDRHKVSRAKLAYVIDATAAPVCMIAPVSSWAAAVSQYAEDGQGLKLFVTAIPYNYYSLLTLVFIVVLTFLGFDYGKMSTFEIRAKTTGDVGALQNADSGETDASPRGRVFDLIVPILVLIVVCVAALVYNGGFFDAESSNYGDFVGAFGDTDAFVALPWGGLVALLFTIAYLAIRRTVSFKEMMESIPKGFIAMVPAILILTFATSLKNMTSALGAKYFVAGLMENAAGLASFLPAIIFLVACFLAFSTGTSWGTFGILIPIVTAMFPADSELCIIGMSACLAGAVCGDHCSPISDTTIMASAGAQSNHVEHVETQLPYAITVAGVSFVCFLIASFVQNPWIMLPIAVALLVATLFVIKAVVGKKNTDQ